MPGIIPAIKRAPTDSPEERPYKMKGMLGGMMTPNPPDVATRAVTNILSYPKATSIGMHMAPTAAVVAGAEPEIAP